MTLFASSQGSILDIEFDLFCLNGRSSDAGPSYLVSIRYSKSHAGCPWLVCVWIDVKVYMKIMSAISVMNSISKPLQCYIYMG